MEVIAALLEAQRQHGARNGNGGSAAPDEAAAALPMLPNMGCTTRLVALLLQQAVEKIDRLRERAFGLLRRLLLSSRGSTVLPMQCVELAYRRVCYGDSYRPGDVVEEFTSLQPDESAAKEPDAVAWPPECISLLAAALREARGVGDGDTPPVTEGASLTAEAAAAEKLQADRSAAVFDALVPLLAIPAYRPAIALGLVVSMGGITEYTAKGAKRALLQYLQDPSQGSARCTDFAGELLRIFERVGVRDADSEAKRLLAALFATTGILLSQDCFPADLAPTLLERALAASRSSRDITRLRASIAVFVGLLRWSGQVRRKAMGVLLQFLGYSFPIVRQATAQALYIRLLEEAGDFDLRCEDGIGSEVPSDTLTEVLELISITPWSTDNEEVLAQALREVYQKFAMELPTAGRSILAPKKPKEEKRPKEAEYADLVRENHF